MMDKKQLRNKMIDQRLKLTAWQVSKVSERIVNTLENSDILKNSNTIMTYMSFSNEVDLDHLNRWILDQGKRLCLPRVRDSTDMDAVSVKCLTKGLVKSRFGILEPSYESDSLDPGELDLILVPGLAFDTTGSRLGYGKGYYDRFLCNCTEKTFTIGIAYDFQILDKIPSDEYDRKVKGLVTEKQWFSI